MVKKVKFLISKANLFALFWETISARNSSRINIYFWYEIPRV